MLSQRSMDDVECLPMGNVHERYLGTMPVFTVMYVLSLGDSGNDAGL